MVCLSWHLVRTSDDYSRLGRCQREVDADRGRMAIARMRCPELLWGLGKKRREGINESCFVGVDFPVMLTSTEQIKSV